MVSGHDFVKATMWGVIGFYKNSAIQYAVENKLSDEDAKKLLEFGDWMYRNTEMYIRKI